MSAKPYPTTPTAHYAVEERAARGRVTVDVQDGLVYRWHAVIWRDPTAQRYILRVREDASPRERSDARKVLRDMPATGGIIHPWLDRSHWEHRWVDGRDTWSLWLGTPADEPFSVWEAELATVGSIESIGTVFA